MGDNKRLNKDLWTNIIRLRLLNKPDTSVKFILEHSPFDDDDDIQSPADEDQYVIIGRIFPTADIYKEGSFRIEMKLTSNYPAEPPTIRFLTPIYHPNVGKDGTFCHRLLTKTLRWKKEMTLVDVVTAIIKHMDEPDPDYAFNFDIGKEYMQNKEEFNRKTLEMMRRHSLPRD